MTIRQDDEDRIAGLEADVERLGRAVAALRADWRRREESGVSTAEPMAFPPAAPPPRPSQTSIDPIAALSSPGRRPRPDFQAADESAMPADSRIEQWIGRYGTMALGVVTVLVAAGTFMSWAISQGVLGPRARLAMGAAAAVALAIGGMTLRRRGTTEFGNALIALALAVVHVLCWSAGPSLGLVPSVVALGVAFAASVALAAFAQRNEEQALFNVGFGGAALAPFVTSSEPGRALPLAAYGAVVIALAMASLRVRDWTWARRMVGVVFAVYLVATIGLSRAVGDTVPRWEPFVPLALALLVIALAGALGHPAHRRGLVRVAGFGLATAISGFRSGAGDWPFALALGAIGTLVMAALLAATRRPGDVAAGPDGEPLQTGERRIPPAAMAAIDAAALPLALLAAHIELLPAQHVGTIGVALAAAWGIAAVVFTHRTAGTPESNWHPVTAAAALLWIPIELDGGPFPRAAGVTAIALLLSAIASRLPRLGFLLGAAGGLFVAGFGTIELIRDRPAFTYPPFLTGLSAAAAVATAGWVFAPWFARRRGPDDADGSERETSTVWTDGAHSFAAITAFLWIRGELIGGWNASVAFVAVVAFYAIAGFIAIEVGRARASQIVRLAGLGLTLVAAGKALGAAVDVPQIAYRVGLLLVVGMFLMLVAYRYRRAINTGSTAD